jgi:excisionase family DNA binding protein
MTTETVTPPEQRPVMTVAEVCQVTGLHRDTVYDLARRRELPGLVRLGKRVLIARKAFMNAMDTGWTPEK